MNELISKTRWQKALAELITDPKELLTLLNLDLSLLPAATLAAKYFPLKVTQSFIARIEKGNVNDPLLKQILPLDLELNSVEGYTSDPLQEKNTNPVPGLLHKYHGRVLLTLTGACAIHCRYCFRRNFPYNENNPGRQGWDAIFKYIDHDKNISEVILSGGDPLVMNDKLLTSFTEELSKIPHVKRLRIHTRIPIVLPERITDDLLTWLTNMRLDVCLVVHANHPQEINHEVKTALLKLKHAGISVFNQSVLLRGINDDPKTLITLSQTLFTAGVIPYYLHVLDKVQGTKHFDLPRKRALDLHQALIQQLPGYLVPRLVCEEPGMTAKTWLSTQ